MFTVVVTDRVSPAGLTPLEREDFRTVRVDDSASPEFDHALRDCHALIVRSATTVDEALIARAPGLKVIGRAGVGLDNIDVESATKRGIVVFNAPDANTVAAAELTMALMLALARKVVDADRSVREGVWDRTSFRGIELRGKTLGLVGAGRIGGEVARRARAFDMTVIANDPYLDGDRADNLGVELVDLEQVVTTSDFISVHVPLNEETRGLVGEQLLSRVKDGCFLVNASRGGVVDESALVAALETGKLGGAALDVFATEPLPETSTLRIAPNLILTPHLGASTAEAQLAVARDVADAVVSALIDGDNDGAVNSAELAALA